MDKHKIETESVKAGKATHSIVKPVSMPLYLSTTYEREADGSYSGEYVYTRMGNPNRDLLEKSMARLENGVVSYAFSSGMAAISAVLQSLSTGDHILLPDDVYYKIRSVLDDTYSRWGLSYTLVDMTDLQEVKSAIQPHTKMLWLETPSNPMLKITDVKAMATLAKACELITVVDNTWATPVLLSPLELGADVVVHSTTKYISGHSDVLGGVVVCKEMGNLSDKIQKVQVGMGSVPSPFDCWLASRGIQTLPLRIKAQSHTAMQLARYLADHPKVEEVYYPGLLSHTGHMIAADQMSLFGAMISITIRSGEQASRRVCNRLRLFTQATSLGGVESLVEHRSSVEGRDTKTPTNLLRLSIGLEHIDDLIGDFTQALE